MDEDSTYFRKRDIAVTDKMFWPGMLPDEIFTSTLKFYVADKLATARMIAPNFLDYYLARTAMVAAYVETPATREDVGSVVLALFNFKQDYGYFPKDLDDLTAGYMQSIPYD